jgi:hypothetical protein
MIQRKMRVVKSMKKNGNNRRQFIIMKLGETLSLSKEGGLNRVKD